MEEQAKSTPPSEAEQVPPQSTPYETALNIAFNRLTSQILIFLLAYVILLIGIAVLGAGIETRLLTLLYIIPILGVVAYVWLQRRSVPNVPERNVDVSSLVAKDDSLVAGEIGDYGASSGDTKVSALFTSGSTVAGRMIESPRRKESDVSQDLIDVYKKLAPENRSRLLTNAFDLLKKQR
jgi:hypothetical protein